MKPDNIYDYITAVEDLSKEYGIIHKQVWNKSNLFWGQKKQKDLDYKTLSNDALNLGMSVYKIIEWLDSNQGKYDKDLAQQFRNCLNSTYLAISSLASYINRIYCSEELNESDSQPEIDQLFNEYYYNYKEYVRSAKAFEKFIAKNRGSL